MNIGTPIIKLNTRGQSGKATMPIERACREMGPERESRTRSLDRSLSRYNLYGMPEGVTTGQQLSDWYVARVAAANARIRERRAKGETAFADGKQMAANCVSGTHAVNPAIEVTFTPDEESLHRLSRPEQVEVLMACKSAFEDFFGVPIDAWAIHLDERDPHMHAIATPTPGDPDHYSNRDLTSKANLLGWHRAFDKLVTAHLDPAIVAKAGGIAHHRDSDERAEARAKGEVVPPAGLSANDYAELRESQRNLESREDLAERGVRYARQAVTEARADADAMRARAASDAADIELTAHHAAAGEEEAARQASDAAFDRLDAIAEAKAESDLAAARAAAALAATTRRRREEEARLDAAKAKADRAEEALDRDMASERRRRERELDEEMASERERRTRELQRDLDQRHEAISQDLDAQWQRATTTFQEQCDRARDKARAATRGGATLGLRDVVDAVVRSVIGEVGRLLGDDAADRLRRENDEIVRQALEAVVPAAKVPERPQVARRSLADYGGPEGDARDDYERED